MFSFWNKRDNLFLIAGIILGTFVEILGTFNGRWHYVEQQIFNIPLWLPFAWGYLVLIISKMMLLITEK